MLFNCKYDEVLITLALFSTFPIKCLITIIWFLYAISTSLELTNIFWIVLPYWYLSKNLIPSKRCTSWDNKILIESFFIDLTTPITSPWWEEEFWFNTSKGELENIYPLVNKRENICCNSKLLCFKELFIWLR